MKHTRKIIAVILTLTLVLSMCPCVFADKTDNVKHYETVCCIGDSVGTGYSGGIVLGDQTGEQDQVDATKAFLFNTLDSAFGRLTAKAVGGSYYSLTCVGLRAVDFLYMLDAPGYTQYNIDDDATVLGDAVVTAIKNQKAPVTATQGKTAIDKVKESNLILIQLGANDAFANPFFTAMMGDSKLTATKLVKALIQGEKTFKSTYPQMLERIRFLNPNATIVLLGQFNPYEHLAIRVLGKDIELGQVVTTGINRINKYYQTWAEQYNALYVDCSGVTKFFKTSPINVEGFDFLQYDTHYSPDGHQYVANKIIGVLPDNRTAISKPQEGKLNIQFDGQDAGDYTFVKKLLGWQIIDENGMYVCFDNYKGFTLRYSSPTTWKYNGGFYVNGVSIETKLGLPILRSGKQYLSLTDSGTITTSKSKATATLYLED